MGAAYELKSVESARREVDALLERIWGLGQHSESLALGGALAELKAIGEALQARCLLLRSVLDRSGEVVFAKHRDGRFALLNPYAASVFGCRVEDILGKDDRALASPSEAQRIMDIDAAVMRSGTPSTHTQQHEFGGRKVELMVTTTVWRDEDSEVRGVIGVARDAANSPVDQAQTSKQLDALRGLATESVLREERLRRALAAELHEGLGQDIALARLRLSQLRAKAGTQLDAPLRDIESLVEQADRSLRAISFQLSPSALHDLGLIAALESLADELRRTLRLSVRLACSASAARLDERVALIVYRAVRELLVNVAHHSGVREATVRVEYVDQSLRVTVEDAGRGFDVDDASLRGYGLFGIGEQLRALGGAMLVESSAEHGARVTLTAPLHVATTVLARDG
jgi:PAS domain S-box-containing protein